MTVKYADRVQETTTSTGEDDLVLQGAPDTTFQEFGDAFDDGDQMDVGIFGAGAFEVCRATYNAGANSITRGTIHSSSTGDRIDFGGGAKIVIVSMPAAVAEDLVAKSEVDPVAMAIVFGS